MNRILLLNVVLIFALIACAAWLVVTSNGYAEAAVILLIIALWITGREKMFI